MYTFMWQLKKWCLLTGLYPGTLGFSYNNEIAFLVSVVEEWEGLTKEQMPEHQTYTSGELGVAKPLSLERRAEIWEAPVTAWGKKKRPLPCSKWLVRLH